MTDKAQYEKVLELVDQMNAAGWSWVGNGPDPRIALREYAEAGLATSVSSKHQVPSAPSTGGAGSKTTVMRFEMFVDSASCQAGHQKFRTEGWLNTGLEKHLATCKECRDTLAKDLRDFAEQIEAIPGQAPAAPEPLDFEGKLFNLVTDHLHRAIGLVFSERWALTQAMLKTASEFITGARLAGRPGSPDFGLPGEKGFDAKPIEPVLRYSPRPNHLGGLTMTPDPNGEWIRRSDAVKAV